MAAPDIPKTMKAYVVSSLGKASIQDVPLPYIGPDEVLIKNYAAAQNPTDWQCAFLSLVASTNEIMCTY